MDPKPFSLPHKFLLGAGPVNCSERVLKALSMPSLTPVDKSTLKLVDDIREMLKVAFHTKNRLTFGQQTSGTGGLETVIANVLEPGQKIIVAIGGAWGQRIASIADKYSLEVIRLSKPADEVYSNERLEEEIKKHRPNLLFITHGESSTGVLQPLEGLAQICHRYNCLLAVDAVITMMAEPLYVDKWELDITVSATQKAVGAPPGFALLTFSPRAEKIVLERKLPVPFYFDIKGIAYYWHCFGGDRGYYYTVSSNMLAALREALQEKLEEGLENVWRRHKEVAETMWKNMQALGLGMFVKKPEYRLHSISTYTLPEGIRWQQLLRHIDDTYAIDISFGIGPTTNIAIRLGLMGVNANPTVADYATKAIKEGVEYCRKYPDTKAEFVLVNKF